MNINKKIKSETILVIISAIITIFIQYILNQHNSIILSDLRIDFISYVTIYMIVYSILYLIINIVKKNIVIKHFIICIVVLFISSLILLKFYSVRPQMLYKQAVSEIDNKDPLDLIELKDNKKSFILVYTSKECPYCVELIPEIIEDIREYKKTPVYCVQNNKSVNCDKLEKKFDITEVPYVVKIEKGKIIQNYYDDPVTFFEN